MTIELFAIFSARSQSIDSAYSFYPLHIGDVWEYNWGNCIGNPPLHLYYQKTEVIGDSAMQNGNNYFVLRVSNLDQETGYLVFQRIDSLDGFVHQWIDSAHDSPVGRINLRSAITVPDTILGVPTQVRFTGVVYSECMLAYGFGIVAQSETGSGWPYYSRIIYARINGIEYGTPLFIFSPPSYPSEFALYQNYPNPFNPSTTIRFSVPTRSRVRLTIFNLLGQQIVDLANEEMNAGSYERTWNANVASGMYFYRIEAVSIANPRRRFVGVKKMILVK